jgi:hypothetical protein
MLRHCTIDELLELRDGGGSAGARSHVEACAPCRAELDRLYQVRAALKALPSMTPPRDRWGGVREGVVAQRQRARRIWAGWATAAAAAAIVLIVGVTGLPGGTADDVARQELESLMRESEDLETLLQSYHGQAGRVVDGMTAAAIADIEDRIAAVDWTIQQAQQTSVTPVEMTDLWRQRVALMDQLVNTHVRQVQYVGF